MSRTQYSNTTMSQFPDKTFILLEKDKLEETTLSISKVAPKRTVK